MIEWRYFQNHLCNKNDKYSVDVYKFTEISTESYLSLTIIHALCNLFHESFLQFQYIFVIHIIKNIICYILVQIKAYEEKN